MINMVMNVGIKKEDKKLDVVKEKKKINKKKTADKKIVKKNSKVKEKDVTRDIDGNVKKRELYTIREVIAVMLFSLGIGFIMCFGCMSLIMGKNYFTVVNDLDKVVDTYYAIVDNYYGDLDEDKLVDGAVEGMISSVGDIFTSYTDSKDADSFNETIEGSYEGIGCTIATYSDGSIVVIDIFDGSPADKAGLKINDKIIKVDDVSYENKTGTEMSNYIKNSGKEKVVLTIIRNEEEIDIIISLSRVEISYVTGKVMEENGKKIGYIKVGLFSNNSYDQFKEKLNELEDDGIEGLIIDVRDNNGGYLTSVTEISSLFMKKGNVIYQLEDYSGIEKKKDKTKESRDYGVAVIINGASASASEILASVIKEGYGGYVVGTTSYGKGTVQQIKKLLDGSMIKYTTQKWLTPNGNSIDGVGVVPTNYVEISEEYLKNPSADNDNQITHAFNLLLK